MGGESVEDFAAKIVKADIAKAKSDMLDKTKTPAQILADNKIKFQAIDAIDDEIRNPGQHAQHAALRKEVLTAAAIVKFNTIDNAVVEIDTLIKKIKKGKPDEMLSGADLIAFNAILILAEMRWKTKTFSNARAIQILDDNKGIMTSVNKLVDIANAKKPKPPPPKIKTTPRFATVQSIQSKDISPDNYPIDISSNVSR